MHPARIAVALALLSFATLGTLSAAELIPIADVEAQAKEHKLVLVPPHFESTPAEIHAVTTKVLAEANAGLDQLAKQDPEKATFDSTFVALDAIEARVRSLSNRLGLLRNALPNADGRNAADEDSVKVDAWSISLDYRNDIYQILKKVADKSTDLTGEDKLFLFETMRDYRRAGLALEPDQRDIVENLRKLLSSLTTEFNHNVVAAVGPFEFTKEEGEGLPSSFLETPGVRVSDGHYRAMLNITYHAQTVLAHAKNPDVRKRAYMIRNELAKDKNVPLMAHIVQLRTEIARRLGYKDWADYQTEIKMVKTGDAAKKFEEDLVAALQPKFDSEMEELRKLKVAETGKADAKLDPWDIAYYLDEYQKQKFSVDAEQLRVYFPYQAVLDGMFKIYERIFSLKFAEVQPKEVWADGVRLFVVKDATTDEPMGLFYLDMFPRDGKYNHFACFQIADGIRDPNGVYECPIAALECNFPPPSPDRPSLLKHEDVETLFHEFGHVMHLVLSRSKFNRHTAFGVPGDFVEAPSQMLENWAWNKTVLDTFAADYRDPSKKVPAEIIDALEKARIGTAGMFYRRQLSFGILDLDIHMLTKPQETPDIVGITNRDLARVYVAPPDETAFIAYFSHLCDGYDAGYYGYMWSLAIAQDMASVFRASPDGFLDVKTGRKLRDEIYGVGASREVSESIEAFLGRKESLDPFQEFVGAKPTPANTK
jgi:Zn-dependent oligopeptidase